jgi:hypothetical protein
MEIATNTSVISTSQELISKCIAVGGTPLSTGACLCPYGLSSEYDAMVSGDFCSIPNQYGDIGNDTSMNSTESNFTDAPITVTLSGVIQLAVSFALSMVLVCIVRKTCSCCNKKSQSYGSNSYRTNEPYWYS